MKALTFLIELQEPLLATQVQIGEANSGVSYSFIPGSMIRGALASQYTGGAAFDDVREDKAFCRLFLDGQVSYLNAYPANPAANWSRALPKPLSWFAPKEDADKPEAPIYDFAWEPRSDKAYKSPATGDYLWQTSDSVQLVSPDKTGIVHNTSDNPNRKDEVHSQVYRYEALAPGQRFTGAILAEDGALLNKIKVLLDAGRFNLGGSHTAGYGRVSISNTAIEEDWQEFMPLVATDMDERDDETEENWQPPELEYAILTCLSDLIWRDKNGQISADLCMPSGIRPVQAFYRLRPTGGFNRKWGLPLCQAWAIQAGSVFLFPRDSYAELEKWVAKGVGERRTEGFGRVALDWHTQPTLTQSERPPYKPDAPDISLSAESRELAQAMADRQLQVRVDRALTRRIQELSNFQNLPKTAHLSRARLTARRAWHKGNLQEIVSHFAGLSPTAAKQWETAKVNNQGFKKWILTEIERREQFSLVSELPKVAGVEAQFAPIRDVTLARLIEGVLRRAVKKAKARDEGGQDGAVE